MKSVGIVAEPIYISEVIKAIKVQKMSLDGLVVVGQDTFQSIRGRSIGNVKIKYIDFSLKPGIESEVASNVTKQIFLRIRELLGSSLILWVLGNEAYINFFAPLLYTLVEIKRFLDSDNSIEKVFLFGGNHLLYNFPIFFADGERPFTILSHRAWALNPFIYDILHNKTMIYWRETWVVKEFIISELRKWIMLIIRSGGVFRYYLRSKFMFRDNCHSVSYKYENVLPIIIRNSSQFKEVCRLYNFIFENTSSSPLLILGYSNMSQNFIKNFNGSYISISKKIFLRDIFYSILKAIQTLLHSSLKRSYNVDISIFGFTIKINLNKVIKELDVLLPDIVVRERAMKRTLEELQNRDGAKEFNSIITTEFIAYGSAIHKLACKEIENSPSVISVQGIATSNVVYPFFWADYYLFSSKEFYNFIKKKKYGKESSKFIYVGDFVHCNKNLLQREYPNQLGEILVLTQPDNYSRLFMDIILGLCKLRVESNHKYSIVIKPHPRDRNVKLYKNLKRKYKFVRIAYCFDIEELCKKADVVITSTSSTIYDAFNSCRPIISVTLPGATSPNFVKLLSTVEVVNVSKIGNILDDFQGLVLKCKKKYESLSKELYTSEDGSGCKRIYNVVRQINAQKQK